MRKVFAVLLVVPVVVLCTSGPAATQPKPPGKILGAVNVVGDSITQLATDALDQNLRSGYYRYEPTISGRGGTNMAQNLSLIESDEQTNPAAYWVIELGTNDALGDNWSWWVDFRNEVQALQGQQCVVFVTVGTNLPRGGDVASGIDLAIFYETLLDPNVHEVDWGNVEYSDPAYTLYDGIHPSPLGSRVLAEMIHKTLNKAC